VSPSHYFSSSPSPSSSFRSSSIRSLARESSLTHLKEKEKKLFHSNPNVNPSDCQSRPGSNFDKFEERKTNSKQQTTKKYNNGMKFPNIK
jgi:hypothetical protein